MHLLNLQDNVFDVTFMKLTQNVYL